MTTPSWIDYPHVTTDAAVQDGQPCIADTGIRVTELITAHQEGRSAVDLQEYFRRRTDGGDEEQRFLTLSEVFAGLAYYHDNVEALEALRVEEQRLEEIATKERHAAIIRRYGGSGP